MLHINLYKINDIHSITGDTKEMSKFICDYLEKLQIKYFVNPFGTVIAGDPQTAKIMYVAHIDQVGFQITKINGDGTCKILPIGWVFPNRLDHVPVYVKTKTDIVHGAIFHNHFLKTENLETFANLFLFVGTTSKDETLKLGIREGDTGSFKKEYWETENAIFASGLDNCVSIFALLSTLEKDPGFINNVMIAFHNDEEMQDHGGNSLGYEYPIEYCCILDYCPVHQKFDDEDEIGQVNEGPFIVYRGGSHIIHEQLKEKLDKLEKIKKIFISNRTLPSLEPQNFQNNGVTKAFNYCIPAIGYHGQVYGVLKKEIEKFKNGLFEIKNILLK